MSEAFLDRAARCRSYGDDEARIRAASRSGREYGNARSTFRCGCNRCGVLAAGGQFGRADQGHLFLLVFTAGRGAGQLTYIGLMKGYVAIRYEDCPPPERSPRGLLVRRKCAAPRADAPAECSTSPEVSRRHISLRQLSLAGAAGPVSDLTNVHSTTGLAPFDIPWMVFVIAWR
jgi:hypothetical protein